MSKILPIFTTHYSIGSSLLTTEEPRDLEKRKPGGPVSIPELAKDEKFKHVVIVDDRIDGFIEAYKNIGKSGAQLVYGVKLTVCADMTARDENSLSTESSVIVFIKKTEGYNDLLKIWNRAWTDGFYYRGRIDWKTLKEFWTPNLTLGLPFFSSFIARNALSMNAIVPDLPSIPWVFREIDSGLPFAEVINKAIDTFKAEHKASIQPCKTIYYKSSKDFKSYVVMRAIHERAAFDSPRVDNLASDKFSFDAWKELASA